MGLLKGGVTGKEERFGRDFYFWGLTGENLTEDYYSSTNFAITDGRGKGISSSMKGGLSRIFYKDCDSRYLYDRKRET